MDPIKVAIVAFLFAISGAWLGNRLRRLLPTDTTAVESKDVIKLSLGIVVSLTALVLGLLVASAKSGYEMRKSEINQLTAGVVLLDYLLSAYGPGATSTRIALREEVPLIVQQIWSEGRSSAPKTGPFKSLPEGEAFFQQVLDLQPETDVQRELRGRIVQSLRALSELRLMLYSHFSSSIPLPFLAILLFWIIVLFAGFALMAPPSPVPVMFLLVSALSVSGAVFLILELDQPFSGIMAIPSEALRGALAPLN